MIRTLSHTQSSRSSSRGCYRRAAAVLTVSAVVLLSSGCGGGNDGLKDPTPKANPAPSAPAGVVLNVTGTEYSFAPSPLKATAGPTTIRFTNKGAVEHDFMIDALQIHLDAQPGKTVETSVTLKPGTYRSYCSVPGHNQSGMQGTLTVS